MKQAVLVSVALMILTAWCSALPAAQVEYDSGTIETMSEGAIYVKGRRGVHVLEPLSDCYWCEVGLEVSIKFTGFTRATLSPFIGSGRVKPVGVLILRDGRDEL